MVAGPLYMLGVSTHEFCFIPLCLYICACVWLRIQGPERECRSIRPAASGLSCYCAPLVCVSDVIGGLAVWRHNKPKRQKKPPMSGIKATPQPRPCQSSVALLWVLQPPRTGFAAEFQVSSRSKNSIRCQNSKRIIFVFWKLVISRSYDFLLNSVRI